MNKSNNKKVQIFLDDILLSDDKKFDILQELRKIVFSIYPEVEERMMYGGIMFNFNWDFWGIFSYKNHISFEFTSGYKMKDENNFLEWKWEYRKHLKIKNFSDIENKKVEFYVRQVI